MYLKYGDHIHDAGEVEAPNGWTIEFSASKIPLREVHRWSGTGVLYADNAVDLKTKMDALEAAYRLQGQDIGLYQDDNTPHQVLLSANCLGGTRSLGIQWPNSNGAEGGTWRTFTFAVEGDVLINTDNTVVEWQEAVTFSGGGPLFGYIVCQVGSPYKYLAAQQTPYQAEQSGSAVGIGSYPTIPGRLWQDIDDGAPQIQKGTPQRSGDGGQLLYPISWSYKYKDNNAISQRNPSNPPD